MGSKSNSGQKVLIIDASEGIDSAAVQLVKYYFGAEVRLGIKFGVDPPVNRFVYNSILPIELKARKKLSDCYEKH
jgi:hypothetical protein